MGNGDMRTLRMREGMGNGKRQRQRRTVSLQPAIPCRSLFPVPHSLPFLAVPAVIVYARAVIIIRTGDAAYGHADY